MSWYWMITSVGLKMRSWKGTLQICMQCDIICSLCNNGFARGPFISQHFLSLLSLASGRKKNAKWSFMSNYSCLSPHSTLPTNSIPFHRLKLFLCYLNSTEPSPPHRHTHQHPNSPFKTFFYSATSYDRVSDVFNAFNGVLPSGNKM